MMKNAWTVCKGSLLLFCILWTVVACTYRVSPLVKIADPYCPTSYQSDLLDSIRKAGVNVTQQGRELRITLPTDTFFYRGQLKACRYPVLDRIALLLKTYHRLHHWPQLMIFGHTDTVFSPLDRKRRAFQQAEAVAIYLWSQCIPEESMQIRSLGSLAPIADNRASSGAAYNRRVVITVII